MQLSPKCVHAEYTCVVICVFSFWIKHWKSFFSPHSSSILSGLLSHYCQTFTPISPTPPLWSAYTGQRSFAGQLQVIRGGSTTVIHCHCKHVLCNIMNKYSPVCVGVTAMDIGGPSYYRTHDLIYLIYLKHECVLHMCLCTCGSWQHGLTGFCGLIGLLCQTVTRCAWAEDECLFNQSVSIGTQSDSFLTTIWKERKKKTWGNRHFLIHLAMQQRESKMNIASRSS